MRAQVPGSLGCLWRPLSALYTAAVWFHRFYMRYSMEDYHRQVRGLLLMVRIVLSIDPGTASARKWQQRVYFSPRKPRNAVGNYAT